MRAVVVTVRNPFDPLGSRDIRLVRRPARVRTLAPRTAQPFVAVLNGRPLMRAGWRRRLRHGDHLAFVVLPRGGGRSGSDPLRLVASLAVLAFAAWAGPLIAGANAGTVLFGSYTVGQATTLGLTLAGQALVNALLPAPRLPEIAAPSPTYSIAAQGNAARVEQPVPVQYGRIRAFPDFAAQPYTEFAGQEQYLYQLLCVGAGDHAVEEILIEDTPVSAFSEIETEVIRPGGTLSLFPANVVTAVEVSGQELRGKAAASWSQSGITITVTETGHNRASGEAVFLFFTTGGGPSGAYVIATVPDADSFTVTAAASATASGAVDVQTIIGGITGFTASGPATVAQFVGLDVVLPRGLFGTNDGKLTTKALSFTVQARRIDDLGAPVGAWFTLGTETISDRTSTPIRRSWRYPLAVPGRYRIRAWRTDTKSTDPADGHEAIWTGLRAYLAETNDWGDVTLVAMRLRASNNLSLQASRKVAVISTRKLPVWTGSAWTAPQATRSIAWAIADAARNAGYGAGLPDARIDLDALLALDAVWAARGDRFDGRFDAAASWWEQVSRIALAGRAKIFMEGGRLRVVRDAAADAPVALFTMRNIRRGSFAIDYVLPAADSADAVEVSYLDATTWAPQRVLARPGGFTADRPRKIDLFGVTDRAQALREGLYHAAANRYRRRIVRFSTEREGFIPSFGDLVAIQHDMIGWGAQAEAVAWDAGSRRLTLSEPVAFGPGSNVVALRRPDGGLSGPWPVSPGPTATEVILSDPPDITPETGTGRERTHVAFGTAETVTTKAKVTRRTPRGLHEVEIEAVVEDPSVHTAETGIVAPPIRTSSLPRRVKAPAVTGLFARRVPGAADRALFAWTPAPDADLYQIEMAEGDDPADAGVSWTRAGDTTAAQYVLTLLYSRRTLIRVRGLGLAPGPWVAGALGDLILEFWNPLDTTSMWTLDSNPVWSS